MNKGLCTVEITRSHGNHRGLTGHLGSPINFLQIDDFSDFVSENCICRCTMSMYKITDRVPLAGAGWLKYAWLVGIY